MKVKLSTSSNQQGVVLIVSLIMLLLLMIVGTAGMKTTIMEEKMAGNARMNNLVFQAAESALLTAENSLKLTSTNNTNSPNYGSSANHTQLPSFTKAGTNGFYAIDTEINLSDEKLKKPGFWTSNPVATSTVSKNDLKGSVDTPKYIIQDLGLKCFKTTCTGTDSVKTYQITVRAVSSNSNNVVILQSVFAP